MAKRIIGSTPKADGYRMPAEFEPQDGVWMLWPERNDNWRSGAKPAQETFCQVARAIARFEKVTMCVSAGQYQNARARLPEEIRVVEVSSNDAWVRDCGPTFLVNGQGGLRAVDWTFNAWGGLYDGLYFPWDRDDQVAQKICEMADVDSYRTEGFVLEGGSIHVDGEGTVLTTEMCLLSPGRNSDLSRAEIGEKLCQYLGCEKVLWLWMASTPTRPTAISTMWPASWRRGGGLYLDGGQGQPLLSGGAGRLSHPVSGHRRQGSAAEGA
ncbi:MAG: agmatine deiminase family protein [Dysosmobacter sp.]